MITALPAPSPIAALAKLASHKASLPRQLQRGNPVIATHRQDLHAPTLPRKRRRINQAPHPLPPRPPSDLLSLRYSNLSRCKTLQMKSRPQNPGSTRECQPSFFRWVRRDGYCQKNLPSIFFRPRPAPQAHSGMPHRQRSEERGGYPFQFHLCGLLISAVSNGWVRCLARAGS